MVGDYLAFQGIEAKARYHGTPVEEALSVKIATHDNRVEAPQRIRPRVLAADHPIVARIAGDWPVLLGYNRVQAKPDATVVALVGSDPLLVTGASGGIISASKPHAYSSIAQATASQ